MKPETRQAMRKAFESYYQYLDEGTCCHNAIIELKTAIDLVIAEIEEKDNRNKEPNRFIKDTVKEIYAKGGIKLITDHVEELRSVISEYYNRIASLEEAMSKAIKLNDIYNIGYVVRLLQTALDKKEASK